MKKSKLIEFTRLFFGLLATCLLIKFNKAMLCWLFKYFCLLGTLDKKRGLLKKYIISILKKGTVFKLNQKWLAIILVTMATGFLFSDGLCDGVQRL